MDYLELETIHKGRQFRVCRGRRASDGARVIVKSGLPEREPAEVDRALRHEYDILRSVRAPPEPPRVCEALGLEPWPDGLALILADAGALDLYARIDHRPLELSDALPLAIELARILAGVHRRRILHRDINPANVVLDRDGVPTLVDFDAATRIIGLAPAELPQELAGTLLYMAPEQTGRMSRGVDPRSDLYALGATLYEVLTGSPPFPLSDPVEIVHAHLARTPVAPSTVNPHIPRGLSDIVLKLLAKVPEQRYQSADSLANDLREAHGQWSRSRTIASFGLGRGDFERALPIPARLYGRQRELDALLAATSRAAEGGRELGLIPGPGGAGKSALIAELVRDRGCRAMFALGKAGQQQRERPYAPWADALRPLLREFHARPQPERARLTETLSRAVGRNGRVLVEILPELSELLSELPPIPPAGAVESENRFHRAFIALVRALAAELRPLVLILDDVQWADSASLALLRALVCEPECPHLLIVLAYRDESREAEARIAALVEAARSAQIPVVTHELGALDVEAVTALLADATGEAPDRMRPLAALVVRKTAGNAYFVRRFLHAIHQQDLLVFDPREGSWSWDGERIERAESTENVVTLMVETIRRLPGQTQALMRIASCFRGWVELDLLAEISGDDRERVAEKLWIAFREGLLVGRGDTDSMAYRFDHDQVQEAAYALLGAEERTGLHLAIGRQLRERRRAGREVDFFEMVDHLDQGSARIEDDAERRELGGLHAEAGQQARAANAYRSALGHFQRGIERLGGGRAWDTDRSLVFALHRDAAECAYLLGDYELGDALVAEARARTITPFESAGLANLQVIAAATRGRIDEALRLGSEGLAALGDELPSDPAAAWQRERRELDVRLGERPAEVLLGAPTMDDSEELARMELLANLVAPAYVSDPRLFAFVVGRMVRLSAERGNSVYSAPAYAGLGMVIGSLERDYVTAYELGRAGAELARSFGDPVQECRTLHIVGCFINHWRAPLRSNVPILRRAVARGLEGGELQFAVYAAGTIIVTRFHRGEPLAEISAEIESFSALAVGAKAKAGQEYLLAYRQVIRSLKGSTDALGSFEDTSFDEAEHIAACGGNPLSLSLYYVLRLQAAFLAREIADAEAMAAEASRYLGAVWGIVPLVDHRLYHSLALAARGGDDAREQILANRGDLRLWAEHSPESFRHKLLLVEAELERLEGSALGAAARYDDAIDAARAAGDERDAAVASELAARFWRAYGRRRIASHYLREALDAYARWGANAKVAALEHDFPELASAVPAAWRSGRASSEAATLDLLALHKAYETLSSEVVLERLLDKLLTVSMEVAGATGAALLLARDGHLLARASAPADAPPKVPELLVERAFGQNEPISVGDRAQARALGLEDALGRAQAPSLLALPIQRQSVSIGVLYLENRLTAQAFTAERVRVLTLLASQIAISLENSQLFEGLKVEIAERQRAEESVRFLADASARFSRTLDESTILAELVEAPVPFFADWCLVHPAGQETASAMVHPAPLADLGILEPGAGTPVAEAIEAAVEKGEIELREVTDGGQPHIPPETRGLVAVPLVARERRLGALVCGASRAFHDADALLAAELARRAAFSLDNARLYAHSQAAVNMRDEFLSIASHELRTPLTSLQLAAQGLVSGVIEVAGSPTLRRVAHIVERQTARLGKLVEDLLDVSRIHAGRLHLALESVDLEEVVREVLDRFESQAAQQHVSVDVHAEGAVAGRWDRARLDQVVTNLLSNALKFGADRPIQIDISTSDHGAKLTVTDHGIGIAPERLATIFDRFERGVSARKYGGLGLGLYITRQIVTALGGTIRAESEPNERTTFAVELPWNGPAELEATERARPEGG